MDGQEPFKMAKQHCEDMPQSAKPKRTLSDVDKVWQGVGDEECDASQAGNVPGDLSPRQSKRSRTNFGVVFDDQNKITNELGQTKFHLPGKSSQWFGSHFVNEENKPVQACELFGIECDSSAYLSGFIRSKLFALMRWTLSLNTVLVLTKPC
jgi:hypothetical protein